VSKLERLMSRWEREVWAFTDGWPEGGLKPNWKGPVKNKKWRVVLAYRAVRGYELDGWRSDGGGHSEEQPPIPDEPIGAQRDSRGGVLDILRDLRDRIEEAPDDGPIDSGYFREQLARGIAEFTG
jgi:hypothetical protein